MKYPLGILASIALVIIGVFVVTPWLIQHSSNWPVAIVGVLFFIPLLPALSGFLQGERDFLREYFGSFFSLFFEVIGIAIMMPFLAVFISAIIGGMLLIALVLGTILTFFGVGAVTMDEAILYWEIGGYIVVFEIVFWLTYKKLIKYEDRFYDLLLVIPNKVYKWVDRTF